MLDWIKTQRAEEPRFWAFGIWVVGRAVSVDFSFAKLPQVQVFDLRSRGIADDCHPKRDYNFGYRNRPINQGSFDCIEMWLEIRPDAVIAQVGHSTLTEIQSEESVLCDGFDKSFPTSTLRVLKRCFLEKVNKEKYEDIAGNLVLQEIFGVGFHGHFLAAKRVAQEVGSSFLVLELPFVKSSGVENTPGELEAVSKFQGLVSGLVPQKVGLVAASTMGKALANAQKMLYDVNRGEAVDTNVISEVYALRIAVEGLRISLNNAGRLPINKIREPSLNQAELSDLPVEDKSHALLVEALRGQTKKFKTIVAVVDASGLASLRKHWKTHVPLEVKEMVGKLVTDCEGAGATAVLGASSLSKAATLKFPASTLMKVVTFKVPASLGPSKMVAPGVKSTTLLKATASAEKIRVAAHSVTAAAEKTSFSAMRTAI
ncbi:hypothetical protein FF2_000645 [Malus domestica]